MPANAYSLAGKRAYVAGHRGMVGGAIVRRLQSEGCEILIAARGDVERGDAFGQLGTGGLHGHNRTCVRL